MKITKIFVVLALLNSAALIADDTGTDDLDEVMASRGQGMLTHREFDARMHRIPEKDRVPFLRDSSRLQAILAELLLKKQLVSDARYAQFDIDETIKARMELAAMTELAGAWLEHYIASAPEADFESLAKEKYMVQPDKYMSEETIDVSHILISNEERSAEEVETRAWEVHARLIADPASFDSLVAEFSDDTASVANNGAYAGVKRGEMVEPFETAAFALPAGGISEPVETRYGLHIIRLDAHNKSRQLSFEEVRGALIEQEKAQHQRRVRLDYLGQLSAFDTILSEESLRKMLSRYAAPDQLSSDAAPESE